MEYRDIRISPSNYRFDIDNGVFEGHAAVKGNIDSYGTRMVDGFAKRTIDHQGGRVPVFNSHDRYDEIGMTNQLEEDSMGIAFRAALYINQDPREEVRSAREAYIRMKNREEAGRPMDMSFGFDIVRADINFDDDAIDVTEIRLYEISPVSIGANDKAKVESVRELPVDGRFLELLKKQLRNDPSGKYTPLIEAAERAAEEANQSLQALLDAVRSGSDPSYAHSDPAGAGAGPGLSDESVSEYLHTLDSIGHQLKDMSRR